MMLILLASFFIALCSLVGVFFFGRGGHLVGTHRYIVPFAIGVYLVIVFFELIPETILASPVYGPTVILCGYILFYLLSNILHTYHHHHDDASETHCPKHNDCSTTKATALLLLWGDAVHNITDGVVIASAFVVNPTVGILTTFGIALHEIPQEIAEFGVLRKAGYSTKKSAILNFISAMSIFVGALLSILFLTFLDAYMWILTGIAAGNLLYIATSDMLPGVHTESRKNGAFLGSFIAILAGISTIAILSYFERLFL